MAKEETANHIEGSPLYTISFRDSPNVVGVDLHVQDRLRFFKSLRETYLLGNFIRGLTDDHFYFLSDLFASSYISFPFPPHNIQEKRLIFYDWSTGRIFH